MSFKQDLRYRWRHLKRRYFTDWKKKTLKRRIETAFKSYFDGVRDEWPNDGYSSHVSHDVLIAEPKCQHRYKEMRITSVKVSFRRKDILLTVSTERPGMLIGARAETLDGLIQHLYEKIKRQINIHIIEARVWQ